jgi:hypothetical protein
VVTAGFLGQEVGTAECPTAGSTGRNQLINLPIRNPQAEHFAEIDFPFLPLAKRGDEARAEVLEYAKSAPGLVGLATENSLARDSISHGCDRPISLCWPAAGSFPRSLRVERPDKPVAESPLELPSVQARRPLAAPHSVFLHRSSLLFRTGNP